MVKIKKTLAIILVLMLAMLLLTACGADKAGEQKEGATVENTTAAQTGGKVKLRFAHCWTGEDAKAPIFEPLLQKFQEENPDIELKIETAAADGLMIKIKTDVAANNTPDSFAYWLLGYVEPFVKAGAIADLTDIIQNDPDLKDRFLDGTFEGATFNGKKYGIPAESYFEVLMVNNNLFKKYDLEYPKTFEDLKNVVKVFKSNGIIPMAEAGVGADPSMLLLNAISYKSSNKNYYKDILNGDVSSLVSGCTALQELVKLGAFEDGVNGINGDQKMALFNDERAAMMYDGSWMIGSVKPELAPKIDFIPFPKLEGSNADPSGVGAGTAMYYFVSSNAFKDDNKKAAALKLIKFLSSPEANKDMLEKASIPPSTKITVDDSKLSPLMVKAMKFRLDAKEVTDCAQNYYPPELWENLVTETQAQFEALKTPQSYADFIKAGLGK